MSEALAYLNENPWIIAAAAALSGYLIGSVSTARLIYFLVTKSRNYEPFNEPIPHTDEKFESNLISATWVTKKLGKRYGCITALLDILKLVLPTLFFKLLFTSHPFFLLAALMGILGHNYPVYYRFIGGRGESPILGALLVINWFGIIVANAAASLLGYITGSILVLRWGAYVLLIFWFWYYFDDPLYVIFMILTNIIFWSSQMKDLLKFRDLKKKKGLAFTEEDVSEFILMGKSPGRFLDKYGLYFLLKKWFKKSD